METGVEIIAKERKRQIEELGYDYSHDTLYADEQLARAGAVYALPISNRHDTAWPWSIEYFRPSPENRIKELAKAGALIAAQIDYIQNNQK